MRKLTFAILFLGFGGGVRCQKLMSDSLIKVIGDIRDQRTNMPMAYATISISGRVEQTYSQSNGGFILTLPSQSRADSLIISYVGYATFKKRISELLPVAHVLLEQTTMVLPEVVIGEKKTDLRYIDRNARLVRDNLYALNCEVTNIEYGYFLSDLQQHQRNDLFRQCDFDLRKYPKASADFYFLYHHSAQNSSRHRKDGLVGYGDFPAVNITYEAALEYCKWLTEKYNDNSRKKKFKKVRFRLPTRKEWQIAALGYYKFRSWDLLENWVEAIIPTDTLHIELDKGKRTLVRVSDRILYPWYKAYYYRDKPQNFQNCFLGNFHIDNAAPCPAQNAGYDGFIIQGRVGSYFPNNMGLYDVVGNVAEMIDERGVAFGGSWMDAPSGCTLLSCSNYSGPDETVGFRVFMDVVEK